MSRDRPLHVRRSGVAEIDNRSEIPVKNSEVLYRGERPQALGPLGPKQDANSRYSKLRHELQVRQHCGSAMDRPTI